MAKLNCTDAPQPENEKSAKALKFYAYSDVDVTISLFIVSETIV